MTKAMFITFEGIEGSGKTTQLNRLDARLSGLRPPADARPPPGAERLGDRLDAARSRADLRPRRGARPHAGSLAQRGGRGGRRTLRARGSAISSARARGVSRPRGRGAAALLGHQRRGNGGRGLRADDGRAGEPAAMSEKGTLLLDTARRGELHHAIILFGPAPDALRALALQVAKTLECLNGTTGDDCAACQRIERRTHPDVHFVEVGA